MLWLFLSCSEWPTYDFIDEFPDSVSANSDHREQVEIDWVTVEEGDSDNNSSVLAENFSNDTLIRGSQGVEIIGSLEGTGWTDALDTADVSGNFPHQGGQYEYDVDWFQITPTEASTLCVSLYAETSQGTIIDAMVYPLNAQVEPTEGPYSDFDGVVAGYNQTSFPAEYSVYIGQGRTLGLVVAGRAPNLVSSNVPYCLYISLMATDDSGARAPCPIPSENYSCPF